MGWFFDSKNTKAMHLVGGLIMTSIFLVSLVCLSVFETKLRKSPFYEQIEAFRKEELSANALNQKEQTLIHVISRRNSVNNDTNSPSNKKKFVD